MNKKYQRKYQLLKKRVKDMIFENAALTDQVFEIQSHVTKANNEKRFLLQRLLAHEPDYQLHAEGHPDKKPVRKKSQQIDRHERNKFHHVSPPKNGKPATVATGGQTLLPYTKAKIKIEQPEVVNHPPPLPPPPPPIEEVKQEPALFSSYPEDFEANSNSFAIDNLVIQSLGDIQPRKVNFHTDRWIYPVGYTAIRIFGSMANPRVKSVYTCRIAEVAGNPRFEMSSEADPEVMIVGPSPQFCLTTLLNYLRDTHALPQLNNVTPDGDWFFGLAHPVVMSLLESQPNFGACQKFRGFRKVESEAAIQAKENDPGINFEAFMQLVGQQEEEGEVHEEVVGE